MKHPVIVKVPAVIVASILCVISAVVVATGALAACAQLRQPAVVDVIASYCETQLCKVEQVASEATALGLDCDAYARAVCSIGAVVAPFAVTAIATKTVSSEELERVRTASLLALKAVRTEACKVQQ